MNTKSECPMCGGERSFYYTPHNDLGYCFICKYTVKNRQDVVSDNVRSNHIKDIRDYYNTMAEYYHSCLQREHVDFLTSRGYTQETIQRRKIGFCPKEKAAFYKHSIAKESGLSRYNDEAHLAGRITFPYFARGCVTDIRGRDGKDERKYLSPLHSAYYRGADYSYNYDIASTPEFVVITEGEIKSDLSSQEGLPCYGLPGMSTWREIRRDQEIVICFDSQRDMRYVNMAIMRVAQKLAYPRVATLPLLGKEKQDIDSIILNKGAGFYKEIIHAALPYEVWYKFQQRTL